MKKPYRGDYKPDYEKWKNKVTSEAEKYYDNNPMVFLFLFVLLFIVGYLLMIASSSLIFFVLPIFYDSVLIKQFTWYKFISYFLFNKWFVLFFVIFIFFSTKKMKRSIALETAKNEDLWRNLAEEEAEQRYQEDLDRYEHYWETKYEEAIRQANIDATVKGISNEELLRTYVRLAEINNQVNERNFALFNQARQALESRNTYSIDDTLNQFRQKFLG